MMIIQFIINFLLAYICDIAIQKKNKNRIFSVLLLGSIISSFTLLQKGELRYTYILGINMLMLLLFLGLWYLKKEKLNEAMQIFVPTAVYHLCNTFVTILFSLSSPQDYLAAEISFMTNLMLFIVSLVLFLLRKTRNIELSAMLMTSWRGIVFIIFAINSIANIELNSLSSNTIQSDDIFWIFIMLLQIMGMICLLFHDVQKENNRLIHTQLELEAFKNGKENYQKDIEFYNKLHTLKHDMKHIYRYMDELIKQKDLKTLQSVVEKNMELIQSDHLYKLANHTIMDMVLKDKKTYADDHGISFESDIRLPQQVEMEDLDIYILLSNLLDNALQHCDMKHPYVKIKGEIKDEYICFKTMNSITESVLQNNPSFITTKSDKENHGYGLASIHQIVNKYDGMFIHHEEDNMLICEAICKIA